MSDSESENKKPIKEKKNKKEKSITQEYIDYHDKYVEKFGKDRTLVLMQVGKFYEAYATLDQGPDLNKLEELTEARIAHIGKNKNIIDIDNPYMWGFPMMATLKYMGILIEAGYRLIIIDQITPKPNIKRAVVAIHSPATYLDSAYKPASNFIALIYIEEIKQKNNQILACVGMSAIDVSTGEVLIHESYSEMNDDKLGLDETVRFLNSCVPKEILIIKENLNKLSDDYIIEYLDLKGKFYQFRDVNKEHNKLIYQKNILEKVYPNRKNMTSIIDTLGMSKTIYCCKSLVNLLTYVSDHYDDLVRDIAEPLFYLSEMYMTLGNDAINQLNIVDNKNTDVPGSVKFGNLMDVINRASTGMGKRYIKMRFVSPYTDVNMLNTIYDTVDVLNTDNYYKSLEPILKNIHDVERLYRKLSLSLLHPMHMVDFIESMISVEKLFKTIRSNKNIIKHIKTKKLLESVNKLNKLLKDNIDTNKAKNHSLSDIKENFFNKGVYPALDKLQIKISCNHSIMGELLDKLDEMIPDKNTKNKKIVLKHNSQDGYYYQLTSKRYELLKKNLDKIETIELNSTVIDVDEFKTKSQSNNIKLYLPFLDNQTDDIDELMEKLEKATHDNYIKFMQDIIENYGEVLKNVIEIVTKIDYVTTISKISKTYNYVRPLIDDINDEIGYIKASEIRHPIVERIIDHEYVPHDIDIGQNHLKGMMIYGLNSAGKSVLMKAIGINVIMAQAGFFVAAKEFQFYPYKALYTRITGNDNIFRGLSSYSLEIVELNSILKRSDASTLVIGDEVCRGTEHISGNAIVATTLLKLSDVGSTFVFATHLHELMELDDIQNTKNIKAFHLSVEHDEISDRLIYDRELKDGPGERIYGITVAKYIIKDDKFIKKALEIKNKLLNRDPDSAVISTKKSNYNPDILMDKCDMCGKRSNEKGCGVLETHHINQQKDCVDGFVKNKSHIMKDQIYNLMVLCQKCHDKIHAENIEIKGIKMTSGGKKIMINTKTIKDK
jgi:DNA mismatch repair protein MutS